MHLDARLDAKLLAMAVDYTFEYSPVALQLAWHIQGYMHATIWKLVMNQMHPTATGLVTTAACMHVLFGARTHTKAWPSVSICAAKKE